MKLTDFAASIPMHLDYLVFDACFMGCIETAYELRGICDKVAFSPAEILEYGFQYETLASHLLEGEPDLYKACKDYFDKYDKETGIMRSATITLVDCSKLDRIASLCKDYFSRYRQAIDEIYPLDVQQYFRRGRNHGYGKEKPGAGAFRVHLIQGCNAYVLSLQRQQPQWLGRLHDRHLFRLKYVPSVQRKCLSGRILQDFGLE